MSQMPKWLRALIAVAAGMFAMPAVAVQWLSDNSAGNSVEQIEPQQITVTVAGQILKVRAYSAPVGNPPLGNWASANVTNQGDGFGVISSGEGSADGAADNKQATDILVFELPASQLWDLDAFRLGFASQGSSSQADVQAWFGGIGLAPNYDFTKVCFAGCTGAAAPLATLGFNPLDLAGGGNAFSGGSVSQGGNVNVSGTQAGRYLVMAGQLGEQNDAFKLEMLRATGTGIGGQTPLPGTLALLGLGLIGLGSLRWRVARS